MRIPDPEDEKYWQEIKRDPAALLAKGIELRFFLADLFIEDFRKWKAELRKKLEWLEKNSVIHGSDRHTGWVKRRWYGQIKQDFSERFLERRLLER